MASRTGEPRSPGPQIRDPQARRFVVTLFAQGDASSQAFYEEVFHFRCRLETFQYLQPDKNPQQRRELASVEIRPAFRNDAASSWEQFVLDKYLGNPGASFSFGLGIGIAVIVQRITRGPLDLPPLASAFLRVDRVDVKFDGQVL